MTTIIIDAKRLDTHDSMNGMAFEGPVSITGSFTVSTIKDDPTSVLVHGMSSRYEGQSVAFLAKDLSFEQYAEYITSFKSAPIPEVIDFRPTQRANAAAKAAANDAKPK